MSTTRFYNPSLSILGARSINPQVCIKNYYASQSSGFSYVARLLAIILLPGAILCGCSKSSAPTPTPKTKTVAEQFVPSLYQVTKYETSVNGVWTQRSPSDCEANQFFSFDTTNPQFPGQHYEMTDKCSIDGSGALNGNWGFSADSVLTLTTSPTSTQIAMSGPLIITGKTIIFTDTHASPAQRYTMLDLFKTISVMLS